MNPSSANPSSFSSNTRIPARYHNLPAMAMLSTAILVKLFRKTLDENGQEILTDVNDEDLPGFKKFYSDSHKFALLLPEAFAGILHVELHGKVPGIVKRITNLIPEVTKILAEKYPNIIIEIHKNAGDFQFRGYTPRGETEDDRRTDTLATLFHELAHFLLTQTTPELPHTPPLKQLACQYSRKPKKMGEIGCKLELVLFEGVITEASQKKKGRTILYRRLEQSHLLPLVSNLDSIAEGRTPDNISIPLITISGFGDKIPVSAEKGFRMKLVECESLPLSSLSTSWPPVTSSESSSSSDDEDGDLSWDDDDLDSPAGPFHGPLLRDCIIMDSDDDLSN